MSINLGKLSKSNCGILKKYHQAAFNFVKTAVDKHGTYSGSNT